MLREQAGTPFTHCSHDLCCQSEDSGIPVVSSNRIPGRGSIWFLALQAILPVPVPRHSSLGCDGLALTCLPLPTPHQIFAESYRSWNGVPTACSPLSLLPPPPGTLLSQSPRSLVEIQSHRPTGWAPGTTRLQGTQTHTMTWKASLTWKGAHSSSVSPSAQKGLTPQMLSPLDLLLPKWGANHSLPCWPWGVPVGKLRQSKEKEQQCGASWSRTLLPPAQDCNTSVSW